MDQPENPHAPHQPDLREPSRSGMSRRAFIKGVIASGAVASALVSNTTSAWPASSSRDAIGPPMRPTPMKPSCTCSLR